MSMNQELELLIKRLNRVADTAYWQGGEYCTSTKEAVALLRKAYTETYKVPKTEYVITIEEVTSDITAEPRLYSYCRLEVRPPEKHYPKHNQVIIEAYTFGEALEMMISMYCPKDTLVKVFAEGAIVDNIV